MLHSVCVDPGQTVVLEKGKSYFLFPNGTMCYYVSNFPNPKAHKGCFQSKYFQIIEKVEWPHEPEVLSLSLDPEQLYKAKLVWRKPGYIATELKEYYVKPQTTHGHFYQDINLKGYGGCFPLHWFTDFEKVEIDENVTETLDFVIDIEENVTFFEESEPKIANYVQMSLFDF
jgi:hypothetical protein